MKKNLLTMLACATAMFSFGQVIPNGSFENWTSQDLYQDLDAGAVELFSSNGEHYFGDDTVNVKRGAGDSTVYLESIKVGEDTLSAYVVWGSPTDDVFEGGFPFNGTQSPSSFQTSVRYKSNVSSQSFFILQFKKNGVNVFEDVIYIEGDSSDKFYNYSWDLTGIAAIPDTIVVGFAVNDLVDDGISIPGDFLEIDYIRFDNKLNSIPGGEMDSWKTVRSAEFPIDWTVTNSPFDPLVTKAMDASEGVYSMKLETIEDDGDTLAPLAYLGVYDAGRDEIVPNIVITTAGEYVFSFDYKCVNEGNDAASVVFLTSRNSSTSIVSYGNFKLDESNVFVTFSTNSFNVATGDSLVIAISSSDIFDEFNGEVKVPGSTLWIDNLKFDVITGLNANNANETFSVYPNPSKGVFKYNFSGVEGIKQVHVVDASGIVVYEASSFGGFDTEIDLTNHASGVYNLVIVSENGTTTRKMMKY